jgi:hypothetical protein
MDIRKEPAKKQEAGPGLVLLRRYITMGKVEDDGVMTGTTHLHNNTFSHFTWTKPKLQTLCILIT